MIQRFVADYYNVKVADAKTCNNFRSVREKAQGVHLPGEPTRIGKLPGGKQDHLHRGGLDDVPRYNGSKAHNRFEADSGATKWAAGQTSPAVSH